MEGKILQQMSLPMFDEPQSIIQPRNIAITKRNMSAYQEDMFMLLAEALQPWLYCGSDNMPSLVKENEEGDTDISVDCTELLAKTKSRRFRLMESAVELSASVFYLQLYGDIDSETTCGGIAEHVFNRVELLANTNIIKFRVRKGFLKYMVCCGDMLPRVTKTPKLSFMSLEDARAKKLMQLLCDKIMDVGFDERTPIRMNVKYLLKSFCLPKSKSTPSNCEQNLAPSIRQLNADESIPFTIKHHYIDETGAVLPTSSRSVYVIFKIKWKDEKKQRTNMMLTFMAHTLKRSKKFDDNICQKMLFELIREEKVAEAYYDLSNMIERIGKPGSAILSEAHAINIFVKTYFSDIDVEN